MEPQEVQPHQHGHQALKRVLIITSLYMVVEGLGGWWTGSLSLEADALHMALDALGLGLALWISSHTLNLRNKKLEAKGALAGAYLILLLMVLIARAAYDRVLNPSEIKGWGMFAVALVGLGVNIYGAKMLHASHESSLNLRAAYLHILGDLLGSIGALISALLIVWKDWQLADPVFSLLFTLIIAWGTIKLVRDALLELKSRA